MAYNKDQIVNLYNLTKMKLNYCNIYTEPTVFSGGAMVMFGLRNTTQDLDLNVTKNAWEQLTRMNFPTSTLSDGGGVIHFSDSVDIHYSDEIGRFYTGKVLHQDIKQLLEFKLKLNRPKDQHDIILLRDMLERREVTWHNGLLAI